MILVIVGTHEQQFNRLLKAIDSQLSSYDIIYQTGHSDYIPQNGTSAQFIPPAEMKDLITRADVIICHAGTGTVMSTLAAGKTPIVVPRLAKYGEHVDDHQVELVDSLAENNLIITWDCASSLKVKLDECLLRKSIRRIEPDKRLLSFLRSELDSAINS